MHLSETMSLFRSRTESISGVHRGSEPIFIDVVEDIADLDRRSI